MEHRMIGSNRKGTSHNMLLGAVPRTLSEALDELLLLTFARLNCL